MKIRKFATDWQLETGDWKLQSAYTLIEILVALTIIGLLFSFGYVSFRDFSRRQTLSSAAKSIQGDLRLAQADAISGQKPVPTACDNSLLSGYNFRVTSDSGYSIEAVCTGGTVDVKDISVSGITITAPSPNPIKFKVLGQGTNITSGQSASIMLTQTGTNNVVTVTVTSGGEIQ